MSTSQAAPTPLPALRRPRLLPLVVVLVLLGGGLAARHLFGPATASPVTGTGPPAPAITAPTVDGGRFALGRQRGKVVVLYAMAAWCTACVPEAAALGRLGRTDRWQRGVAPLLVDESPRSDTPAAVQAFRARTQGPARSWVLDQGGAIARSYGITALDTTIVIDRAGRVAAHFNAPVDERTLRATVERLL